MSYHDFVHNEKTIDAVIRNLEVIGEAAKNIPENSLLFLCCMTCVEDAKLIMEVKRTMQQKIKSDLKKPTLFSLI